MKAFNRYSAGRLAEPGIFEGPPTSGVALEGGSPASFEFSKIHPTALAESSF